MTKRSYLITFFIILIIGIGSKIFYAYRLSGYIDSDPAAIGLMAQDILAGRFNLFFYGQNYNGALEAFWLAPFIWLFGLRPFVLFSGMIALYLIYLLTIYRLGGLWAMAYCAVSTYPLLHNSVIPYGYHLSTLILGNISIILALSIDRSPWRWILLGITGGLGFWNHFTIVYYLAPVGIFLCARTGLAHRLKYYFIAFISFIISSLPFWIYNLRTGFSSFNIRDGRPYRYYPIEISFIDTLKRFLNYHVSGILGIQELNILGYIVWGIFITALIVYVIGLNRKKILFLLLLISIIGFSLSQKFFVISPKYCYFLALYTVVSIIFANLVDRARTAGIIILFFILIFNMSDFEISASEGRHSRSDRGEYLERLNYYRDLISFLDLNKINGIIADFETVQGINLMTDKRILGAELINGRPPTDELVAARDKLAIFDCTDFLKLSMDAICRDYKITDNIAYGFSRYDYYGRAIDTKDWKARSNYNDKDTIYGFDRNVDRFWSSRKDKLAGMYYEVDLGRIYKVYRLVVVNIAPHLDNFPEGYEIEVSTDGKSWRVVQSGGIPQPLFWSGPRIYWDYYNGRWEVIFEPQDARFIRIRQTDSGKWYWMINEMFVYEHLGKKNYEEPVKWLYEYLLKHGIKFVYADLWHSAKIREWSKGKIGTLSIINECYPKRPYTSRLMELGEDTVIIIRSDEEDELERLLTWSNMPIDKMYFGDYICYQFKELNNWQRYFLENQRCLYWLGFTMAKANLYAYHQIEAGYGAKKDKKQLLKFRHLCQPRIEKKIVFKNGITFLGYSMFKYGDRLRISYFWDLPRKLPEGLVVFVHFTKNGKIIFQGDHNLLKGYSRSVERYWVDIPQDIERGVYKINLGLYNPSRNGKRIRIKGPGFKKSTKAEIGRLKL